MNVYAFDIDECLEISNGPVTLLSMMELRGQGHIVGLCGNWGLFCQTVRGWQYFVSFMNNGGTDKETHLSQLKMYVPADDYIMVGNIHGRKNSLGFVCGSRDSEAAAKAGWRFIVEDDFAQGAR